MKTYFTLLSAITVISASASDYPTNYEGRNIEHGQRYTSSISLSGSADGEQTLPTGQTLQGPLYWLIDSNCFSARAGETLTPSFGYAGAWMNGYLYIDYNNDGQFDFSINDDGTPADGSELVSYSHYIGHNSAGASVGGNTLTMPEFSIPQDLPSGIYRIRFKIDWSNIDPAGSTAENNDIIQNGGIIADAMIAIHADEKIALTVNSDPNGQMLQVDGSAVPESWAQGSQLALKFVPADGYVLDYLSVSHAFDATPQHGNIGSWTTTLTKDQLRAQGYKLPGNYIVGDNATLAPVFIEKAPEELGYDKYADKGYELVWCDEFNGPDGSHPDFESKWINSPRRTSTWNKRNSPREDLYVMEDGILTLYAKPNDDLEADNAPMITAAMETTGKYAFQYGIVEARIKVNPHTGNFPAFWMMPETGINGGWPFCGEIDVFEQINNENRSYHTLHAYWTSDHSMSVTANRNLDVAEWHDYTLEWSEEGLRWYIDGTQVLQFLREQYKSTSYTYPFDAKFHIIINQAVGDGSWAANYDPNHTYQTQFDYVRVYQKVPDSGVKTLDSDTSTITVQPAHGALVINAQAPAMVQIYNYAGIKIREIEAKGNTVVALAPGIYIVNGQKFAVK